MTEQQKAKQMLKMKRAGMTLEQIGNKFGFHRERIRQLLVKWYPVEYLEGRRKRCLYCQRIVTTHTTRDHAIVCPQCVILLNKSKLMRKKAWSMKFDQCVECFTNERRFFAQGRCARCYSRWIYANSERRREQTYYYTKKWREKNPERAEAIQRRAIKKYRAKQLKLKK